ncbi:MAG: hypothetical protein ACI9M6_001563 [Hydrogenophaga sp.]
MVSFYTPLGDPSDQKRERRRLAGRHHAHAASAAGPKKCHEIFISNGRAGLARMKGCPAQFPGQQQLICGLQFFSPQALCGLLNSSRITTGKKMYHKMYVFCPKSQKFLILLILFVYKKNPPREAKFGVGQGALPNF